MKIDNSIKTINKDICKSCGGRCCKNCGCVYSPDDFGMMTFGNLKEELEKGKISITSSFIIGDKNVSYYLLLRARNIHRKIVDLFSAKTTCSLLGENGCELSDDKRPQGGVLYIPSSDGNCKGLYTEQIGLKEWSNHQKVLERLTKYFCGKSSQEKIKEDIIDVAYYLASKEQGNVINIKSFTTEDKALWDTLNLIIPTYRKEIETGIHKAKKYIYK